jgi:hypothetical protein
LPLGFAYGVSETEGRKVGEVDIHEVTWWIPDDLSLSTIEEKQAFFRKNVASKRFKDHPSVKASSSVLNIALPSKIDPSSKEYSRPR